jgi:metal-dependent amidase/aminoacylase/carboxypeptidase family protein
LVQGIASAVGATATVNFTPIIPPVTNNAELSQSMNRTLSDLHVIATGPSPTSDDVAYIMEKIPGLYLYIGGTPADVDTASTAPNHSPKFFVDEGAISTGIRVMSRLAIDYVDRGARNGPPSMSNPRGPESPPPRN